MFRFTIRDVLWLTLVVGLGAGWSVDHVSFVAWRREQIRILRDDIHSEQVEIYSGADGFIHIRR